MDFERLGNLIEAGLWFSVATVLLATAAHRSGRLRVVFAFLAVAFSVFGATDLIESETGAWWRPLWLLAVKAICVAGFVFGFSAYYKLTRQSPIESENRDSN